MIGRGMSKYIEQSKVNDEIVRVLEHTDCKDEYIDRVLMAIEKIPTIEVSEDCISRSELIERFIKLIERAKSPYLKRGIRWAIGYAQSAPSVVPSRADGEWIYIDEPIMGNPYGRYRCSECEMEKPHKTDYCPYCGAKMKG